MAMAAPGTFHSCMVRWTYASKSWRLTALLVVALSVASAATGLAEDEPADRPVWAVLNSDQVRQITTSIERTRKDLLIAASTGRAIVPRVRSRGKPWVLQKKWARLQARENSPHVFAVVFEAEAHLDYLLPVRGQRAQPLSGLVFSTSQGTPGPGLPIAAQSLLCPDCPPSMKLQGLHFSSRCAHGWIS